MVLQEVHEEFCEMWSREACAQLTDRDGNSSFVPIVPNCDPDLTLHENVNNILLNENGGFQGSRRKFNLVSSQTAVKENQAGTTSAHDGENRSFVEPCVVPDPNDVSRTLSDIQDAITEPNCSAIAGNEVSFNVHYNFRFKKYCTKICFTYFFSKSFRMIIFLSCLLFKKYLNCF